MALKTFYCTTRHSVMTSRHKFVPADFVSQPNEETSQIGTRQRGKTNGNNIKIQVGQTCGNVYIHRVESMVRHTIIIIVKIFLQVALDYLSMQLGDNCASNTRH